MAWTRAAWKLSFFLDITHKNVYDSLENMIFLETILSLFNDKRYEWFWSCEINLDRSELRFHVWWQLDIGTEFINSEFLPMFISYFRFCFGGHRIELSNRLLYGFMLNKKLLFRELKTPSNIFLLTVLFTSLSLLQYICQARLSWFYLSPSFLSQVLSRKTANQKNFISKTAGSLYESIYSAIDGDQDLLGLLYSLKIWSCAKPRPNLQHQASLSRKDSRTSLLSCFHWKSILSCIEQVQNL
jgi:hypothetical protein